MSVDPEVSPPTRLEQRVAELELSAQRLRTILEHAPVMIDSFDDNGRCTLWNRECERRLGWSFEEIASSEDPLALAYPDPEERDRVLETIGKASGEFREYSARAKDGGTRVQLWADFRLPVTGELISVGYDITEQRDVEERLRQSQKLEAVGRLTGGMAHDFNNLLTVILGNAQLIEAGLPEGAEDLKPLIEQVQSAAEGGARLIRKLLTFSRRLTFSPRPIDLGEVVREIHPTLERLFPESIDIELAIAEDLPIVEADPDAVEQILLNLATNSRDAMPDGGLLLIRLHRERLSEGPGEGEGSERSGEFLCLTVRDAGTGMSEATLRQAFEPFYSTKPIEEGAGLGLSIVYGVMEQHGGFVEIRSEARQGTVVTAYFPVRDAAEPKAPAPAASPEPTGGSETILVAEDEAPIREIARMVLEGAGYTVLQAENGERALTLLQDHGSTIDLVVTDVVMPKMGGRELRREATRLAPEIRFLLMTGYADPQTGVAGDPSDAERLLTKPWTPQELLARVRKALD